jgi:hypothetical protein
MSVNATQLGLAFVPGPVHLPQPFSSVDLQEIAEYSPEAITTALLHLPNVILLHLAEPSWWEWKAR